MVAPASIAEFMIENLNNTTTISALAKNKMQVSNRAFIKRIKKKGANPTSKDDVNRSLNTTLLTL